MFYHGIFRLKKFKLRKEWRFHDFSEGAPTPEWSDNLFLKFFCRKLHENERN